MITYEGLRQLLLSSTPLVPTKPLMRYLDRGDKLPAGSVPQSHAPIVAAGGHDHWTTAVRRPPGVGAKLCGAHIAGVAEDGRADGAERATEVVELPYL